MNQQPYKQEFPISGIANGVCESGLSWKFFATNCEPFKQIKQLIPDACFVSSASRGVFLANDAQTPAVIFVPIRQLPQVLDLLTSATLQQTVPVILVVEDHPMVAPTIHPRRRLRESGVPTLEPSNALEAEFIGFAAGTIATSLGESVAIIAHHGLLGAASSSQERAGVDKVLGRLQGDTKDPIRLARRLELNRQRTLPSPGERGSVGFVTVGLSDASLRYLISELRLLGRVPALNLRLVSPIDCVPVQRLLTRCHNVVVLEPRPGEIESEILTIAEQMRREGEEVASVWGRELPQVDPGEPAIVVPVDFIHPSIVARLIKHLLHEAKPLSEVEHQLIPPRPSLPQRPTRRPHLGTA
ncbi:MAG: hypothetical protein QGI78_03635, partial [Phycisphaerales bacterium]|nr:hypothetical protein [Phycisphaerales bacterium]